MIVATRCNASRHPALPCIALLRSAPLRIAPQRNAPLGSLEPLGRLRDAEGYQLRIAIPRCAAPCPTAHLNATQC